MGQAGLYYGRLTCRWEKDKSQILKRGEGILNLKLRKALRYGLVKNVFSEPTGLLKIPPRKYMIAIYLIESHSRCEGEGDSVGFRPSCASSSQFENLGVTMRIHDLDLKFLRLSVQPKTNQKFYFLPFFAEKNFNFWQQCAYMRWKLIFISQNALT